ncbi:unnamed protein product [Brassicogethes aeneus]|uniref:Uncharacterized protein n=1 Tax=Brassicogethes aeneus TaxID=1431903 RepID=A0A9P0AMM9_BRAAE|nr:unnamed protein product [Brassicogethes aeneus]
MMSFKVLFVLSAFVAIISAKSLTNLADDGAHSIKVCDTANAKTLVYQTSVVVEGKFLAHVEKHVSWPSVSINDKDITCVMAIDQDTNGHGGYASIVSGGLYEKEVEIRLTSQLGKGLNYMVTIYTNDQ